MSSLPFLVFNIEFHYRFIKKGILIVLCLFYCFCIQIIILIALLDGLEISFYNTFLSVGITMNFHCYCAKYQRTNLPQNTSAVCILHYCCLDGIMLFIGVYLNLFSFELTLFPFRFRKMSF